MTGQFEVGDRVRHMTSGRVGTVIALREKQRWWRPADVRVLFEPGGRQAWVMTGCLRRESGAAHEALMVADRLVAQAEADGRAAEMIRPLVDWAYGSYMAAGRHPSRWLVGQRLHDALAVTKDCRDTSTCPHEVLLGVPLAVDEALGPWEWRTHDRAGAVLAQGEYAP